MTGQGTIVATGSIAYPPGLANIGAMIGAEKVMTMTSTYDHRIIQGAESGRFLQTVEAYLQGENGFYEGVFARWASTRPAAAAPGPRRRRGRRARRPRRRPPRRRVDEELLQAVQAATSLVKAHRTHGHLAARWTRSARSPRATRRSTRARRVALGLVPAGPTRPGPCCAVGLHERRRRSSTSPARLGRRRAGRPARGRPPPAAAGPVGVGAGPS